MPEYNDCRYNGFSLQDSIPSSRSSIKHNRELSPNPARPRSYTPANCSREPIDFCRATQISFLPWFSPPLFHEYHCSSRGGKPHSFYFEPLSASRLERKPAVVAFRGIDYNEPRFPISLLPIFGLPEVCVDRILSYLSDSDLAALALVDKDCRQLARARQFRSVLINYSGASMDLLKTLVSEGCGQAREYTTGPKWTLGACIRRISITIGSDTKHTRHKPTSWVDSRMRDHEAVEYHQSHMNLLELALQVALPNLQFLDWSDKIPITPVLTRAIMKSSITRLELHGVKLSDDFDIRGHERERGSLNPRWRLRRLVLSLNLLFSKSQSTSVFTRSILTLAAPTLEELVWEGSSTGGIRELYGSWPELIPFKMLKKLHMRRVMMTDDTILSSLISDRDEEVVLTHMWLDGRETRLGLFFARRGHIPSLKHVTWTDFASYQDNDLCVSFFSANRQLETFRLEDSSPKLLDQRLIPLFAYTFHSLTSLALVWETVELDPVSLGLIGNIITLKRLWLSAGAQWGAELDWLVDHDCLKKKLSPLWQLQWFALTRDHYANGHKHCQYTREPKSQDWEDDHCSLMVRYAVDFAQSHVNLEWVYFGQVPMSVTRVANGVGEAIEVVPLVRGREDCEELLTHMWGKDCIDWAYLQH